MNCEKYVFLIFVTIPLSDAVQVNMQGSIQLGSQVVESLSNLLQNNYINGRRSISAGKETNDAYMIIKSTYLCRGFQFCDTRLEKFLNEFITVLTKLIQGIFVGIMNNKISDEFHSKTLIFEEELRKCLNSVKRILRDVNAKITDDNESHQWAGIIKKVSALFQETAINFVSENLEGSQADVSQAKKKLTQKIVVATTMVEEKYETKLCGEYDICTKYYECTKALNTLLGSFKDLDDEKVKVFMRYFYAALPETQFFPILSEVTVNEFQVILNDMAYSNNVPSKTVLLTLQKTVQERLDALALKKHVIKARDVELVHIILSDMDYFYSKSKSNPFHEFLSHYYDWVRLGGKLGIQIKKLMKEISEQLSNAPPDVAWKLTNEVRVFLEITVDPEKQ